MGTFRSLSDADVTEILAAFALPPPLRTSAIAVGTINTNVAVELGERRLFLRVNEGKAKADVEREAGIVQHLAARGLATPEPLRARDGRPFVEWRGLYVSLFPWVEGRTLGRDEVSPEHARQVGAALARLHLFGAEYADRRPGRYEPDEIARRFARIEGEVEAAGPGGDPALHEAVAVLGPELAALAGERAEVLPLGLIHGDLFIDNVLYLPDGRLSALLDFEQAAWGRLAYDVAVTALAFGYGREDFRPEVTRAFLAGYRGARAPLEAERQAFGAELRFACCRFAVTRITDVYLRCTPGAPPGKDFRRYLARLASVKRHLAARDGLLAL
jgi:homoserine kinase type II